jgi:Uma2 family endonuclease
MVEFETLSGAACVNVPQPLENGESLHASEFLRRYEVMPELTKAELIQGIVYIMSPVCLDHGEPDNIIQGWLFLYTTHTLGVKAATNATIKLSADDVLQPGGLLRISPDCGG